MSAKKVAMIALAAAGGYYLYMRFLSPAARSGNMVSQYSNPQYRTQPGQAYPVKPDQPVRNDNQSEPWYGGLRNFLSNPSGNVKQTSQLQAYAQDLSAVGSIAESVSGIWDSLDIGGWFSSGGEDFKPVNVQATENLSGQDWFGATAPEAEPWW